MAIDQERTEPSGEGPTRRYTYMVPPVPDTIGDALRRDRLAKDLDQAEVAAELGFHQSKLSAYELGKIQHPPPERLMQLAELYGRPEKYYLDIGGWPSGAELVTWRREIADCLVTKQPRAGLQDLIETLQALDEPAFRRIVARAANEATWQREGKGKPETGDSDHSAARDSA